MQYNPAWLIFPVTTGHFSQLLLLPEAVDDYVAADNPVRFIEAFVDGLDLAALWVYRHGSEGDGPPGLCSGGSAELCMLLAL